MRQIYFFTNIAPHYREALWQKILENHNYEFHFFYSRNNKSGIKLIDFSQSKYKGYQNKLHLIRNYRLKDKVLVWQKGTIKRCFNDNFDEAIFLGEMYCISTWIASIVCRMRGISVIFWGHGIYGNESGLKCLIRLLFLKLANKHLLYERRAKNILIGKGFNENNLYVIFNSLDYYKHLQFRRDTKISKSDTYSCFSDYSLPVIVFIGRLRSIKRIDMLIESVLKLNSENQKINLIIIGDGPERDKLKDMAHVGIIEKNIHFEGACYDENKISEFLFHADLCVSPGHVGLTAVHSLSLGTPVITHNNFANHAPEVEAIVDGENGLFFKEDDINDLTTKISLWINKEKDREEVRRKCFEIIDRYYNPDYQVSVLERLISDQLPEL